MNPPTSNFQLPTAPRILIRGTNWLGDAVMTTPALLRLREKFPDSHIAILAPDKLKDLWLHHPAINEIVSFAPGEGIWKVAKRLRLQLGPEVLRTSEAKFHSGFIKPLPLFDIALVLPNSPRSVIEVWLAGIPKRIGYTKPWRNFFLTQTAAPRADAVKMQKRSIAEIQRLIANPIQNSKLKTQNSSSHQIHEYLHLAAALGANPEPLAPKLFVSSEEIDSVKQKFGLNENGRPIFGLNPGAEYGPAKRWPVERFISSAKEIQQKTNCAWILFGGKNDLEITNQIESATGNAAGCKDQSAIFNLAGKTSLRELMSLLKCCRVLLTNDTGPMHVAAALGVPVVAIFGSTSPELTSPISSNEVRHHILKHDVPCSPCFLRECPVDFRCMNGISVGRVVDAVLQAARFI